MGFKRGVWLTLVLAVAALAGGCATVDGRMAVPVALQGQAEVPDIVGARFWGDEVPSDLATALRERMPNIGKFSSRPAKSGGRPLVNFLALSGGGPDGAFGAGLLIGLTRKGTRPVFDVVTGVSAGAIIAPFAFLGSHYDRQLEEIWTRYGTQDLIQAQLLSGLLGTAPAVADTAPMAHVMARYITRKLLDEVAAEYKKGRLLLIGTTNLDAQRPVIWNMGEIASSRHPAALALFRKVILASAAIPGAFPPVKIRVRAGGKLYDELHVDGGTTREVFIAPVQLSLRAFDKFFPRPPIRRIYVIKNGKLSTEYEPVKEQTLSIAARSIATLLKYQTAGDLFRIYVSAKRDGAAFHLAYVPHTFAIQPKEAFDRAYMRALFKTGFEIAQRQDPWARTLPELGSPRRPN